MAFRLLRSRTIFKGRIFTLAEERWRGPGASTFGRQTIRHPGAVAIVPFARDGRILLIRQFRPAVRKTLLEIPAGTLESGETPLACAKRELIEEIGFAARRWKRLGAIYTVPGICSERIVLFKAWDLYPASAEQDADEHIALAAMTHLQIRRAVHNGRICDAKTLSALLHLQWALVAAQDHDSRARAQPPALLADYLTEPIMDSD